MLTDAMPPTYIVLSRKFAEFFNCDVLHFKLVPGTLLYMTSDHKLHIILHCLKKFREKKREE